MSDIIKYTVPKELERKILTAIELKKELEQYDREIKAELLKAMQEHDVVSIKNDRYTISRSKRASYKAYGDIPKEFTKTVLDTSRVGDYDKLYGALPDGVEKSTTEYISWRMR